MRFFEQKGTPDPPENMAVAARLQAVTDSGKIETAGYAGHEEPVVLPQSQRLFQMSGEPAIEAGRV